MNLADKINGWLEDNPNGCDEAPYGPMVDAATSEFREALTRQFIEKSERHNVSASGAGKCVKQLAYQYHKFEPEPFSPRTRMAFIFGDTIEIIVKFLAKMSGVEILDEQKEVDVKGLKGHITLGSQE